MQAPDTGFYKIGARGFVRALNDGIPLEYPTFEFCNNSYVYAKKGSVVIIKSPFQSGDLVVFFNAPIQV